MSRKTRDLIILIIVISIIVAIIIHFAFIPQTDNPWIYAKWTGGEILTYIGTISLGVIAIGQNGKMEDISSEANKMNVLSKAIEYEMSKKEKRELLLEALNKELNAERIVAYIYGENLKGDKAMAVFNTRVNIKSSIDAVICVINDDLSTESQELQESINICDEKVNILLSKVLDKNIEDCNNEIIALKKSVAILAQKKDSYFKVKQSELDKFIYNDLIDMKKIY